MGSPSHYLRVAAALGIRFFLICPGGQQQSEEEEEEEEGRK